MDKISFLFKAVTIYFNKKIEFDYKNNYKNN